VDRRPVGRVKSGWRHKVPHSGLADRQVVGLTCGLAENPPQPPLIRGEKNSRAMCSVAASLDKGEKNSRAMCSVAASLDKGEKNPRAMCSVAAPLDKGGKESLAKVGFPGT
jgi:hypothetical protein